MNAFLNALDRNHDAALTAGEILRADMRHVLLSMLKSSGNETPVGANVFHGMSDSHWHALTQEMMRIRREAKSEPQTADEADQDDNEAFSESRSICCGGRELGGRMSALAAIGRRHERTRFWSLDSSGTIRTVGGRVLLLVTLLLCPAVANAQLIARDDTHVKNASATNFRDADRLIVGDFGKYTSFIRFDLSMLPIEVTGNEIQKATLRLFIGQVGRAGSFDVSRVQGDWNEATLSFDTAAGIVGNVEAIVPVAAEHANEYLLVDLTALVKEWVDGTQPNDGVALVPIGDVNLEFDSKEAKGTSHDPRLEIVLSPPETANGVTSVTADSPLLVATPTTTPHISLGTVPVALGGTGLTTPGAAGSLLRSDGSAWTSAPLSAPDIPPGSAFYIRNAISPQPAKLQHRRHRHGGRFQRRDAVQSRRQPHFEHRRDQQFVCRYRRRGGHHDRHRECLLRATGGAGQQRRQ